MFRESQAGTVGKEIGAKKIGKKIRGKKQFALYIRYGFYLHLVGETNPVFLGKEQKNCVIVSTRLSSMFFPQLLSLDAGDIEGEEMEIVVNMVEKRFWLTS